jgi:hypothetical protein
MLLAVQDKSVFSSFDPPQEPVYIYHSEQAPDSLYQRVHRVIGQYLVPASDPNLVKIDSKGLDRRSTQEYCRDLKVELYDANQNQIDNFVRRVSISVNGELMDVLLLGKKQKINNGRWALVCLGNKGLMEDSFNNDDPNKKNLVHNWDVLSKKYASLDCNFLFYNPLGVGNSGGSATKNTLVDSYKAVREYLEEVVLKENQERVLVEIAGSLGAGLQSESLEGIDLTKKEITRVFVKIQPFSYITLVVLDMCREKYGSFLGSIIGRVAQVAIRFFEWEVDTLTNSMSLSYPEIIVQNATTPEPIKKEEIIGDQKNIYNLRTGELEHKGTVISADSSLATSVIEERKENRTIIGVQANHVRNFTDVDHERIVRAIEKALVIAQPAKEKVA